MTFHRSTNQSDQEMQREIFEIVVRQMGEIPKDSKVSLSLRYLYYLKQAVSLHFCKFLFSRGRLGERLEIYQAYEKRDADGFFLLKNGTYTDEKILPPGIGIFSWNPSQSIDVIEDYLKDEFNPN